MYKYCELSDPTSLGSSKCSVQACTGLASCHTQYHWTQSSAEPKNKRVWWVARPSIFKLSQTLSLSIYSSKNLVRLYVGPRDSNKSDIFFYDESVTFFSSLTHKKIKCYEENMTFKLSYPPKIKNHRL
jgi:hypothetical protein